MDLTTDSPPLLRAQLLAYMVYPTDETGRHQLIASTNARAHVNSQSGSYLSPHDLKLLSDAPRYDDYRTIIDQAARQHGVIVGETLIWLLRLKGSGLEPSLGKAQHLLKERLGKAWNSQGVRLAKSDNSMRAAWGAFKIAAPLWAAWQLTADTNARERGLSSLGDDPVKFLALAETLHHMAENIGQRETPLLGSDTWRSPLQLDPMALTLAPLDAQERAQLEAYKPRDRY